MMQAKSLKSLPSPIIITGALGTMVIKNICYNILENFEKHFGKHDFGNRV